MAMRRREFFPLCWPGGFGEGIADRRFQNRTAPRSIVPDVIGRTEKIADPKSRALDNRRALIYFAIQSENASMK